MHHQYQAPNSHAHPLFSWAEDFRRAQSEGAGHRLGAYDSQDQSGQGPERSLCAHLTTIADGVEALLAGSASQPILLPGQDRRHSSEQGCCSEGLHLGNGSSKNQQARHSAHDATLVCDGHAGSRSRLDGYQQVTRPQQLYNDNGVSALSPPALGQLTESDRLAASSPVPTLGRSQLPRREQPWGGVVPSVHSIIVRHTDATLQKYGDQLCPHVESTLLRMHFCRSSDLGKRVYRCEPCNFEKTVFNSCGDRNCPQCVGAKRSNWLDSTLEVTIPQATYFQVVFTLPQQLSSLALGNRKVIYDLLFESAWESLQAKIKKELGIQAAGVAVLHTWNQRLGHHPHVHIMVPGNGPSLDGKRWIACRMEWCRKSKSMKPFLVDNKELGREFRDLFLTQLTHLVEQGKINLEESGYIADLIGELRLNDWVAFIEGPPKPDCPPSMMLKYLTRYLTGGPISDRRIVGEKGGRIYFVARSKRKGEGQEETSLSRVEFVRQWSLHILPKEYTKSRFYGEWSGRKRRIYMDQCRALAPIADSATSQTRPMERAETTSGEPKPLDDPKKSKGQQKCARCGGELECILTEPRPKWRELFYGPSHPSWFEWTSRGQCVPPDAPIDVVANDSQPPKLEPDIFDEIIASQQR